MAATVSTQVVHARKLAAVRRRGAIGNIASTWKPALDQVWAFLRSHPGLHKDGHNLFLYRHQARRNAPIDVDLGVEVTRSFEPSGEVHPSETPAGEVATAMHVGPYDRLKQTHDAIHAWVQAHQRRFAG